MGEVRLAVAPHERLSVRDDFEENPADGALVPEIIRRGDLEVGARRHAHEVVVRREEVLECRGDLLQDAVEPEERHRRAVDVAEVRVRNDDRPDVADAGPRARFPELADVSQQIRARGAAEERAVAVERRQQRGRRLEQWLGNDAGRAAAALRLFEEVRGRAQRGRRRVVAARRDGRVRFSVDGERGQDRNAHGKQLRCPRRGGRRIAHLCRACRQEHSELQPWSCKRRQLF
mmetsp:Transcript_26800/g.82438  ORF Transcript_26800/g.82438 Transcript_26800/m.82438 type:complete len:232 (-) Transcript_26800:166-861(-)